MPPTAQTNKSHNTTTNCHVTNVLNQTIPAIVETMTAALTHFTTVITSYTLAYSQSLQYKFRKYENT